MTSSATEVYVDPGIAGTSGDGSKGTPYGDLQFALDDTTLGTDGTRFNIKAGTSEILSAALDTTTHGTTTTNRPIIFQGYTTDEGDGGQGSIDGNATVGIWTAAISHIYWIDVHLTNTGANDICTYGSAVQYFHRVEFSNSTTGYAIDSSSSNSGVVVDCNFHDLAGGINCKASWKIIGNYFKSDASTDFANQAINLTNSNNVIERNIFSLDGAAINALFLGGTFTVIRHNSFFTAGGGDAIETNNWEANLIENNLFEGWSDGIEQLDVVHEMIRHNAFDNCTNNITGSYVDVLVDDNDNEELSTSPFAKSGSDTFALRATYFAPVDTGNVQGGAYPTLLRLDKGAVQHADPAGGGGLLTHPGMGGGMRG